MRRRRSPGRLGGALRLVLLTAPGALAAQESAWRVASSSVVFEARNAGLPVRGSFGGLEARVCFDPDAPARGSLAGAIDPATIRTGIALRDRHLQRRGWFDVDRYGRIEMRSVRLVRKESGYIGLFLLRIRDTEREVRVPFDFVVSGEKARVSGTLRIDRLEYGLGEPSLILADEVAIAVELGLERPPAGASDGPCGN